MQVLCLYGPRKSKPRVKSELRKQQYTVTLFDCNYLAQVTGFRQMPYCTIFALFYYEFKDSFQVQTPAGLFLEGRFNGGFFALLSMRGLLSEFYAIYRWLTVKQILSKLSFQIFLLLAMETLFSASPHLSSSCLVAHKAFYVHSSSRSSWCFWSVPVTYSARRRPVGFGPRASYSHSCCEDRPQCPLDKVNFPCFWFL